MNREGVRCAAELADARVDVMSTACLVAIMAMGLGYHRKMEEELTAAARANHLLAPVMTMTFPFMTISPRQGRRCTLAPVENHLQWSHL